MRTFGNTHRVTSIPSLLIMVAWTLGTHPTSHASTPDTSPRAQAPLQTAQGADESYSSIDALLLEVGNPAAQRTNDSIAPREPEGSEEQPKPPALGEAPLAVAPPEDASTTEVMVLDNSSNLAAVATTGEPQTSAPVVHPAAGNTGVAGGTPPATPSMTAPTTAHELPFVDEIMGTTETDPRDFVKLTLSILGVLSAIALVGWQLVRHRSQQNGSAHKAPRALQLMATLPLAPKRQILLIRVRDTEMAVASTEHGIALLGDVTTSNRTAIGTSPRIAASLSPLQIDGVTQESLLETEVTTTTRQKQGDATLRNQPETKSEILRKALQTIEDRRRPEVQKKQSKSEEQANFSRSTLPPGNEATRFKKLFSNSYKQTNASTDPALESERGSFSTPNGNQGHGDSYSDKQTENVAQLIREKLKHMRTIS